jgi:lysophospholipase
VAGFARRGALDHVTNPLLVAIAGREMLVDNRALRRVAAALPSAETLDVPEAKHEILQERDESREKFWTAFDAFAARVAP